MFFEWEDQEKVAFRKPTTGESGPDATCGLSWAYLEHSGSFKKASIRSSDTLDCTTFESMSANWSKGARKRLKSDKAVKATGVVNGRPRTTV